MPGFLTGVGLGGFVDGIVLHQILQWHHMVSDTDGNPMSTVEGLEANTLADGFFHLAAWVLVMIGTLAMLRGWQDGRRAPSWRFHVGLLVAGWGAFNVVEGVIDHLLLGVHHVRDDLGGLLFWDIGFLVFGASLVAAGWALHRSGDPGATGSPGGHLRRGLRALRIGAQPRPRGGRRSAATRRPRRDELSARRVASGRTPLHRHRVWRTRRWLGPSGW